MACHTRQAELHGVDVLWWSDHDNLMSMVQRSRGHDFDNGALVGDLDFFGVTCGHGMYEHSIQLVDAVSEVVEGGPSGTGWYWHLAGTDGNADGPWYHAWHDYLAELDTRHQLPLMSDARITVQVRIGQEADEDWQLVFAVLLSVDCSLHDNAVTWYLGGEDMSAHNTDNQWYIPMPLPQPGVWTEIEFPLSAAVAERFEQADDQSARGYTFVLRARNGATAEVDIDDLQFHWEREGEDLRDYQREVLDERYSDGPVTHFVGQEVTLVEADQHLNPFGEDQVPLLDYGFLGGEVSAQAASDHIHANGGIAMCNHPLGIPIVVEYEDEKADLVTELAVEAYVEAEAHGCDLVEVGYRERVVDLQHYLMFWDLLALEGYPLVGTGTNDHHWARDWLDFNNPFLSWVFLDVPSRAEITEQLSRGRVFFGDPNYFVDGDPLLDIWTEHGAIMGETLISDLDQVLHVETGYVEGGWTLALVVDGEVTHSELLVGDEVDTVFDLPRGDMHFVRAQLVDEDGVVILVSNPIYFEMP